MLQNLDMLGTEIVWVPFPTSLPLENRVKFTSFNHWDPTNFHLHVGAMWLQFWPKKAVGVAVDSLQDVILFNASIDACSSSSSWRHALHLLLEAQVGRWSRTTAVGTSVWAVDGCFQVLCDLVVDH